MNYQRLYSSPIGPLLIIFDETAVKEISFTNQTTSQPPFMETVPPLEEVPVAAQSVCKRVTFWLDEYFSGKDPGLLPPLHSGTEGFRKRVEEIMLTIPYGQTMTYGEIAAIIAKERGIPRMSAQAVGGAVGRNPIAILIPCHRVMGARGKLTGYGGGLDKKKFLLSLEHISYRC